MQVGELFDSTTQTFNKDNFNILLKYLTGNASATMSDVVTLARTNDNSYSSSGYSGVDASVLRAKNLATGGTEGSTMYIRKNSGRDICVRLGGLDWEVVYLTYVSASKTILTLWLDNNKQEAWEGRSSTEGEYYGFLNGGLYSNFSPNYWESTSLSTYPYNLYGTSYVNAVTLNNGGVYGTSNTTAVTVNKSASSAFSMFTMPEFGLTYYLATPSEVSWQQTQSAKVLLTYANKRFSNESFETGLPDTDFYYDEDDNEYYNYNDNVHNADWANSYLWLPSVSEVGSYFSPKDDGLWNLSDDQRANADGCSTLHTVGQVGTKSNSMYDFSLLRSTTSSNLRSCIKSDGTVSYTYVLNSFGYAIRPALHLDLSRIRANIQSTSDISGSLGSITLSSTSSTYDGTAKTPTVTVKYNTNTLTKDTNYRISYSLNGNVVSEIKDAGTYTITARGVGSYKGLLTATYTVNKASISSISLGSSSSVYSGSEKSPSVTVKSGSTTLIQDTDYTISYTNSSGTAVTSIVNVGTYNIIATGTGNYTGTKSTTYSVTARSLGSITLSASSSTYDGTAKSITATVKYSGTTLTSGTDYTLSYKLNGSTVSQIKDAGTYSVIATGKGNYTGTVSATYTVNARTISSITVSPTTDTYTGSAKSPTITVKYSSTTLTKNTEYTLSYKLNGSTVSQLKDVGTYYITATGKGNYTGTVSATYTIGGQGLTSISLSSTSSTYTGSAKSITATVKYNSTTLSSGTDYTLSYTNSSGSTVSSIINAGTYTITATGKGNYSGTVSATYTVNKANLGSITLSASSSTYDGTTKSPTITVKNSSSTTLTSGSDYTLSYTLNGSAVSQIKDAGTYSVIATGTGNYTGTKSATYTVNTRTISSITVSPTSGTYTGSALSPTITVKYNSTTLTKNTEYILTYTLNGSTVSQLKEIGSYTITATGTGNYTGTRTATYTISGSNLDSITMSSSSGTYTGATLNPTITVKCGSKTLTLGTDYTLTYTLNGTAVSQIQASGTYTITATGKGAYQGSVSTTYIVEGGTIASVVFYHPNECVVYKNSGDNPKIYLKDGSYKLIEGTDYTITYSINYTSLTGTATVNGLGNYGGIVSKTFTLVLLDPANSIYIAIWNM